MLPLILRGHIWRVVRVSPDSPLLIDSSGVPRIATTNPSIRLISLSHSIPPSILDQVYVHEATHALMVESGLAELLGYGETNELMAWFVENYGLEIIDAVSLSLGRKVCVRGICLGR